VGRQPVHADPGRGADVAAAVACCQIIGVFSAKPGSKASKLDPVEALRYE
jgi:ABC-type antimicrobial peptide transport system permease subunit